MPIPVGVHANSCRGACLGCMPVPVGVLGISSRGVFPTLASVAYNLSRGRLQLQAGVARHLDLGWLSSSQRVVLSPASEFVTCRCLMPPSSKNTQWHTDTFRQSCPSPPRCRCMAASCSLLKRLAPSTPRGVTSGVRGPVPSNPSAICLLNPGLVRD